MSDADAKRLLQDLKTDSQLRSAIAKAGNAGFEKAAAGAGYAVTEKEFSDHIKNTVSSQVAGTADSFGISSGLIVTQVMVVL